MMRVLPPRVYGTDSARRKRFLPHGMAHPAKLVVGLQLDLIRRYTQPGQWIVDPFGGIGSALLAAALPLLDPWEAPRHVLVHELEANFVADARENWAHLHRLADQQAGRTYVDPLTGETRVGVPLGEVRILQGDSRHLPLPTAAAADGTPAPFEPLVALRLMGASAEELRRSEEEPAILLHHLRALAAQGHRPAVAWVAREKRRARLARTGHQLIGTPQVGGVAAAMGSPPYADSAHKPGNLDAMREKLAELYPGHIGPNSLRNATEYGDTPGQIGNLAHGDVTAAIGSPPYVDARQSWPTPEGADNVRYGSSAGQIGGLAHGDVSAAIGSPPFLDAREGSPRNPSSVPDDQGVGESQRALTARQPYGPGEGQIGQMPAGDVAAAIGSPPFGEANSRNAGGNVTQRPNQNGVGFEGGRAAFVYSEDTPGQVGNMPYGDVAAVVSSPPYAESISHTAGGGFREDWADRRAERLRALGEDDKADALLRKNATGASNFRQEDYGSTPGNIGNLPHVDCAISSPPYGDVASRDRTDEPYCQAQDPVLRAKYGSGSTNRHIDGYGKTGGQIGNLPHVPGELIQSAYGQEETAAGRRNRRTIPSRAVDGANRGRARGSTDSGQEHLDAAGRPSADAERGGEVAGGSGDHPSAATRGGQSQVEGWPGQQDLPAQGHAGNVRPLRRDGEPGCSPQGLRPLQRRAGEPTGALRELPHDGSQTGVLEGEARRDDVQEQRPDRLDAQDLTGDVDACVGSPPYGECGLEAGHAGKTKDEIVAALRARGLQHEADAIARSGSGPNCLTQGDYGHSDGQIGDLPHAAIGSPPYENTLPVNGHDAAYFERIGGIRHTDSDYGETDGQIGNDRGETYASACLAVYRECYRVVRPGGILVLVTGNYVRSGQVIDLAADTIKLAVAAGWTPVERWLHQKATISFWRRLHHQQALQQGRAPAVVTTEDVLVFCKGDQPGWDFAPLPPTTRAPVALSGRPAAPRPTQGRLLDVLLDGLAPADQEEQEEQETDGDDSE